jgi:hypothetical protein
VCVSVFVCVSLCVSDECVTASSEDWRRLAEKEIITSAYLIHAYQDHGLMFSKTSLFMTS